jgi:hypothetical protein
MKNALLALALFAFVGTAAAHEGDKTTKKGKKKEHCSAEAKTASLGGTPSCCAKKGAKTAAVAPAPAPAPAVKSL